MEWHLSHFGKELFIYIYIFITCLFIKNKFSILSAPKHWSSGCFIIHAFMNMVCEGFLCHQFKDMVLCTMSGGVTHGVFVKQGAVYIYTHMCICILPPRTWTHMFVHVPNLTVSCGVMECHMVSRGVMQSHVVFMFISFKSVTFAVILFPLR